MDDETTRLITQVAHLYYDEDIPKAQIARRLDRSRFQIARLLRRGRDEGIITIEIRPGAAYLRQLSHELTQHLALSACIVAPSGDSEEATRDRIAKVTADAVISILHPGESLGFSWGRTMLSVSHHLHHLPSSEVVQLTGTVGEDLSQSPLEILRGLSDTGAVTARPIFAPLFAGSPQSAQVLRTDPAIATVLARYTDLSIAIMSIGSWKPSITQLRDYLSDSEIAHLDAASAQAEMLGIFTDTHGHVIDSPLNARRIAATPADLLAIPHVIAAASGTAKTAAILAIARSGLITTLVTDDQTALELIRQPSVPQPIRQRSADVIAANRLHLTAHD